MRGRDACATVVGGACVVAGFAERKPFCELGDENGRALSLRANLVGLAPSPPPSPPPLLLLLLLLLLPRSLKVASSVRDAASALASHDLARTLDFGFGATHTMPLLAEGGRFLGLRLTLGWLVPKAAADRS